MPAAGTTVLEQVSDKDLALYAELIYNRTGIRVSPQKKTLLSNRLRRRLRQTGIASFRDYYQHLSRLPQRDPEWDAFFQEITTHETYLFRDEGQWAWFRDGFLQDAIAAAAAGAPRTLRIWSAACSTGDEAATIACCVAACLPDISRWRVQVLGTDVGIGAVAEARRAVFGERAMRLVPVEYRNRYFHRAGDGTCWQLKPALSNLLVFRQHNLLEPMRDPPFDLVCLKNVLIYFDEASKRRAVANVRAAVRPGGFLMIGAAEGVGDMLRDFHRHQSWLYQRPQETKR